MRRLALALSLLLAAPVSAQAQPGGPPSELQQLRAREQARDEARRQARTAGREVADLQRQLVVLGAAQAQGERVVGARRERLKILDARERELAGQLGRNQVQLARLLSALQNYGRDPPPALLVDPHSARDAVRATILINAITPELRARGEALKAQSAELQKLRRGVAEVSGALFQAESDVAERRSRIETLIAEKRTLQRRSLADADRLDKEAAALAERARSLGDLVQSLPDLEALAGPGAPSRLTPPAQGPVLRRFGERWEERGRSAGWAWRTLAGAQVVAPAAGRVDYAGPLKGWGGVVILSLGGDWRVVLSGLDTAQVAAGQTVTAGEPLGRLPGGAPGELYMELRRGGAAIDPGPLLTVAPAPGPAT